MEKWEINDSDITYLLKKHGLPRDAKTMMFVRDICHFAQAKVIQWREDNPTSEGLTILSKKLRVEVKDARDDAPLLQGRS